MIRGMAVSLAAAMLVFSVVMAMSIMALWMGRTRASMRVEYEVGRLIERLTGEGQRKAAARSDEERA